MPAAKVTWRGSNEVQRTLRAIKKQFPEDLRKAMETEGNIEVTEMKRRCPVDTMPNAPHPGNLRASIHLEIPEDQGKRVVLIYTTGEQAPYAIYVHEILWYHHPVGQAKFIESVMRESAPYMMKRIGAHLDFDKKTKADYGL